MKEQKEISCLEASWKGLNSHAPQSKAHISHLVRNYIIKGKWCPGQSFLFLELHIPLRLLLKDSNIWTVAMPRNFTVDQVCALVGPTLIVHATEAECLFFHHVHYCKRMCFFLPSNITSLFASPFSPFAPLAPFTPGIPSLPGKPISPGSPFSPWSPFGPGTPRNKKAFQYKEHMPSVKHIAPKINTFCWSTKYIHPSCLVAWHTALSAFSLVPAEH